MIIGLGCACEIEEGLAGIQPNYTNGEFFGPVDGNYVTLDQFKAWQVEATAAANATSAANAVLIAQAVASNQTTPIIPASQPTVTVPDSVIASDPGVKAATAAVFAGTGTSADVQKAINVAILANSAPVVVPVSQLNQQNQASGASGTGTTNNPIDLGVQPNAMRDFLTSSLFGGIPNWALVGGALAGLFLYAGEK